MSMSFLEEKYPTQYKNLKEAGAIQIKARGLNRLGAMVLEGKFECAECKSPRWVSGRSGAIALMLSGSSARLGSACGCGGKKGMRRLEAGGWLNRGAGPENKNWKGGRSKRADGYVLVQLPPAHPFASMGRNKSKTPQGYRQVFEHRLVMAKHLGRPLLSREQVHHIDGNPSNNCLDNLKLCATRAEHSALEWRLTREKITKLEKENAELRQENERLKCR